MTPWGGGGASQKVDGAEADKRGQGRGGEGREGRRGERKRERQRRGG